MFEWFTDVSESFKARLPKTLFKSQTTHIYNERAAKQPQPPPKNQSPAFSNNWI